ncbi:MAG TPA: helix-hairpin-helix domain-containing protein [Bacilli bacterium]|nr:helix-hairpin-helix domain-containing protein [Bacilli bacterium]HPS18747.1 helix-hairpin-helix domain-containing protein [Bacilli bacterium]
MIKIIIGVVIVAFIVIGGFLLLDPKLSNNNSGNVAEVDSTNSYSIEGEISKEGTYKISGLVTMADLIEAAGGVTSNADNLAYLDTAELTIGDTYYISPKYDVSDVCNDKPIIKININDDGAEEMTIVTGITTTVANSIVSYRNENGSFETLEDLMDVYGIGNATYRKIRNYVTLK